MYKVKNALTIDRPVIIAGQAGSVILLSHSLTVEFADPDRGQDLVELDASDSLDLSSSCVLISECEILFYKTLARAVALRKSRKLKPAHNQTIEQTLMSTTKHH